MPVHRLLRGCHSTGDPRRSFPSPRATLRGAHRSEGRARVEPCQRLPAGTVLSDVRHPTSLRTEGLHPRGDRRPPRGPHGRQRPLRIHPTRPLDGREVEAAAGEALQRRRQHDDRVLGPGDAVRRGQQVLQAGHEEQRGDGDRPGARLGQFDGANRSQVGER